MTYKDSLSDRMKSYYEDRSKTYLPRRSNVIIRIDGCHFHTFTRGFEKPFDNYFMSCMQMTAKYLCENIQGCKLAYVQSDEISLFLTDYDNLETDAWFDNSVQKMCSVAASMAALSFNKALTSMAKLAGDDLNTSIGEAAALSQSIETGAYFDARCFTLPTEEVNNYFIWRQQDAIRNSVSGLAQASFSQKELNGKNQVTMKEMLKTKKNIDWDELDTNKKRGACVIRKEDKWTIDNEIPSFVEDRSYVESLIPTK